MAFPTPVIIARQIPENDRQRDTDGDGFGNFCDPDLNNNRIVNFMDFSHVRSLFRNF